MKRVLKKVVSGGQTGVDRAALDAGRRAGLELGGWCPRGRRAEDGAVPASYPLQETPSRVYAQRTRWNVRDSEATLVLRRGAASPGTALTVDAARRLGRPFLAVELPVASAQAVAAWVFDRQVTVLNVAGPREGEAPGIYANAYEFLTEVFGRLLRPSEYRSG